MIENIVTTFLTLGIFLTGYYIGKERSPLSPEVVKKIKRIAQAIPFKKDIGGVERPTKSDIDRQKNPLLKAEEDAMAETFKEILK